MRILFGFAGRIGRLEYFVLTLVLAALMALLVFMLFGFMAPHYAAAGNPGAREAPSGMVLAIVAIVAPIYLWFSLTLQAKRFRDMGWNPLLAICGWIGVAVVDRLVAYVAPAMANASGDGTLFGTVVNLGMIGCLLFWPSQAVSDLTSHPIFQAKSKPAFERSVPSGGVARQARGVLPSPAPSGFGRRSL